jgi:hypothetical protein
MDESHRKPLSGVLNSETVCEVTSPYLSSFFTIFVVLLELSVDPYLELSTNAEAIRDCLDCSSSQHMKPTLAVCTFAQRGFLLRGKQSSKLFVC